MLGYKVYLRTLFFIFTIIWVSVMAYSVNFSKNYPLPIINHISFDAKVKFVRDHVDIEEIDTVIIGSSLALNNVQGVVLEKNSKKCKRVLNISVWSIDAPQVEQMLTLTEIFPKLERIIYAGQFTSFNHANSFKEFDSTFLKKYISNTLDPLEYSLFIANACKDISFCMDRKKEWKKEYMSNRKFSYLDFDYTGSAPLHIYGEDIVKSRWSKTDGATQNPNALKALARIAKKAQSKNIHFYFVQQPYRQAQIDKHKHIQKIMKSFPRVIENILNKYNGRFFNMHEELHLSDAYFADRSHLNDKGSKVVSETLAKYIDKYEK
jgi:hypothetical protein